MAELDFLPIAVAAVGLVWTGTGAGAFAAAMTIPSFGRWG
jgi:hypothetical protein